MLTISERGEDTVKVFRNMGEAMETADLHLAGWLQDQEISISTDALQVTLRDELKTYGVSTPCSNGLDLLVNYDDIPTYNLEMNPIMEMEDLAKVALMFLTDDEFEDMEIMDAFDDNLTTIAIGEREYRIGTDDQTCDAALQAIDFSLWAFAPEFWSDYVEAQIDIDYWNRIQGDLCEEFGEILRAMVGERLDEMKQDALRLDGYGHFLATYDGEEHNVQLGRTDLFIFRTN